jgi:CTP synthase
MRLGAFECQLEVGSRAFQAFGVTNIFERHRHRYEVNNDYRELLQQGGLRISGTSPDGALVEVIELPNHPWFVAIQSHPEFLSKPTKPHPLFRDFVGASLAHQDLN